jgi:hypothetical protein
MEACQLSTTPPPGFNLTKHVMGGVGGDPAQCESHFDSATWN